MSDLAIEGELEPPRKRRLVRWVPGLLLGLAAAAGSFHVMHEGLLPFGAGGHGSSDITQALPGVGDLAYVPILPMTISLGSAAPGRYLRFAAQLETVKSHRGEVELLLPRVVDVLNSYLRAVEPQRFEQPGSMIALRAQMLRRVQIVVGEDRVTDLLISEFVVN